MKFYHILPLFLFIIFSCSHSGKFLRQNFRNLENRPELTLVIMGDSISSGHHRTHKIPSYGELIRPELEKITGKRISLIDSSVPEDTFFSANLRLEEDVLSYKPDVVMVMLGFVDSNQAGYDLIAFQQHVKNFLENLKKRKVFAIILTATNWRDGFHEADFVYIEQYNDVVTSEAISLGFPVINVGGHLRNLRAKNNSEYVSLFQDELHLNEKGHQYVADYIMRVIRNSLKKDSGGYNL